MANEKRSRTNLVAGALSAGLSTGDTTMSSAGLADLGVIDATNHAAITIFAADGNGRILVKEIVYVTAHTAAATTATIVRGQEGTSAQTWASGATWAHTATTKDFDGAGGGSGLIGLTSYNPVFTAQDRNSVVFADLDATNLSVTFVAPPSGRVLVRLTAQANADIPGNDHLWNLRDASGDVAGSQMNACSSSNAYFSASPAVRMTGLTPGVSYTWKWGWAVRVTGGLGARIRYGGYVGPAIMEVWAVNL